MSEKYLGEISTPLLINQIKEKCTQKTATLPIASIDEFGKIYQYIGTSSGSLVHGYFYECVVISENPTTYGWQQINLQPTAGTPTAASTTFDNTTSELQATNVQDAIDEVDATVDGISTDVNNIKDVVPSTATSSNKLIDHDSLGTAAFKNSTDRVSPNNTALVESQSVYSAINTALSSIYKPRGDITCAELTSSLLVDANIGNIYETSDSGTTTSLFLQGAGHPIATGSNVGIISAGQGRILFNLMANAFDLTSYQKKDLTQAVEGTTTVEGALGALSTNKQPKTLDTPITVGGVSQTTVEGALDALNSSLVKCSRQLTSMGDNGGSVSYHKISVVSGSRPINNTFFLSSRYGEFWVLGSTFANASSKSVRARRVQTGANKITEIKSVFSNDGKTLDIYLKMAAYCTLLKVIAVDDAIAELSATIVTITSSDYDAVTSDGSFDYVLSTSDTTSTVTSGSTASITSGGVYDALVTKMGVQTGGVDSSILTDIKATADAASDYHTFTGHTQASVGGGWFGFRKNGNFWHCTFWSGGGMVIHIIYNNGTYTQKVWNDGAV